MLSEIILVGIALFFLYKWIMPKVPDNFPPGPPNYPVVGGALTLKKLDEVTGVALMKLGDIYGPVTGMYLGGKTLSIIVNGYETIKELLMKDEFNGRGSSFDEVLQIVDKDIQKGILLNDDMASWKEQRRFALRHLRDLGFGKSSLEGLIHEEITECIQVVMKNIEASDPSQGISVENIFGVSIINVLWYVVSGKRFKHDDAEFKEMLAKIFKSFRQDPTFNVVIDYTWLRHLPYFSRVFKEFLDGTVDIRALLKKSVQQHKAAVKSGIVSDMSHDFIGEYLAELKALEESGSTDTSFNEQQLVGVCADLFAAGAESTSNSVAFGMLYMLLYPKIQAKVQDEIESVAGKARLPSLDDRAQLPYTEAVLSELFRISSIAPLTVPHSALEDTKLCGYSIPKNTLVMVNLHSIHMDQAYWGDPEIFRPERFIGPDGKYLKNERLIPFGIGKRACPGESLARMNYFLFFAAMMQRFTLKPVPGTPEPSRIPLPGFTVAPRPFKAILVPRK